MIHVRSATVKASALYSAFALDLDIVGYFLEEEEIQFAPM